MWAYTFSFVGRYKYLVAYDYRKICQCTACLSAVDLTLKVITHYGECTPLRVQHFEKLFGKDVIVAHQLLKNDIPQHEYWLVTHDLHRQPAELTQWMQWQTSSKETERGDIRFSASITASATFGHSASPDNVTCGHSMALQ